MKRGLLFLIFLSGTLSLGAQFKTIHPIQSGEGFRANEIGNVTNIREDSPINGAIVESSVFSFESISHSALEAGNMDRFQAVWVSDREIPLAIHGSLHVEPGQSIPIEEQTYQYLEEVRDLLGVENVRSRFSIRSVEEDNLSLTHVRLKQLYKGIPIYGGEIIVHFRAGNPYFLNGYWFPETFTEGAQISLRQAPDYKRIVLEDLQKNTSYRNLTPMESSLMHGPQWEFEQVYMPLEENPELQLCWKVNVHPNLTEEWNYFLQAGSGRIIRKYQNICRLADELHNKKHPGDPSGAEKAWAVDLSGTTRELNVFSQLGKYYLIDASREMYAPSQSQMPDDPVGVIWTLDAKNTSPETNQFYVEQISSNNNSWTNKTAVSAHYNAQVAYEYYKNTFNRNSINGSGGNIISLINVVEADGSQMDNAFWSGKAMFYGNGKDAFRPLAGALDVAGHEMTHGVIQSTANLEYYGEPGAINESFADVFGSMIDRDDWKIGEDVVFTHIFPTGALRDMANPNNGGSSLNDNGYQPGHVNDMYLGEADNAGVHINSGIPNHAFYLFAMAIGKDKAEQIYYKALTSYLTKSSRFVDLRIAIEQAAYDMYGAQEKEAAANAFQAVGISGGSGSGNNYQDDLPVNPGNDLVLFYDEFFHNLVLGLGDGSILQDPLSTTRILSKPSISDNGSEIVFVGQDRMIHYIFINWTTGEYEESIIQNEPIWRNVCISKDGWRIAAITETLDNQIHVYDFGVNEWHSFEVYNPSTVQGVTAGDVDYIDVMEFNYSGEWIMYDAHNSIPSQFGATIEYWDIGFIQVFNQSAGYFSSGLVQKLFSGLPENTSIGNPTFSKNSPYIIAFDYLVGDNEFYILGSNLETGEVQQLYESLDLGYPNYSRQDNQLLFDFPSFFGTDVAVLGVGSSKIDYIPNSDRILFSDASWGVWFSNGQRNLVLSEGIALKNIREECTVYPNPSDGTRFFFRSNDQEGEYLCTLYNLLGEVVSQSEIHFVDHQAQWIPESGPFPHGQYFLQIANESTSLTKKIYVLR